MGGLGRYTLAIAAIVTLVLLIALPLFGSAFLVTQMTRILVYAIFAMSLDLLIGYCGLVSLGHAAFFGVAAYVAALLAAKMEIDNVAIALAGEPRGRRSWPHWRSAPCRCARRASISSW